LHRACAGSAVHSSIRDAASLPHLLWDRSKPRFGAKQRARQLRQYSIWRALFRGSPA
jgi:hypothetical protein